MILGQVLKYLYLASLLGSAIIATYYYKWIRNKKLTLFVPYLWLVFFQEFLMILCYDFDLLDLGSNEIVYNIYRLVTVLFFSYIFYSLPVMQAVRNYIAGISVFFVIAFILNYTLNQSIYVDNSYFALARGFVVTSIGLLFLFTYFQLDSHKVEKTLTPWVWIAIGMIIFYPVTSISLLFADYLRGISVFGDRLYNLIAQVLSIFMYGIFSYAFYLCRTRT